MSQIPLLFSVDRYREHKSAHIGSCRSLIIFKACVSSVALYVLTELRILLVVQIDTQMLHSTQPQQYSYVLRQTLLVTFTTLLSLLSPCFSDATPEDHQDQLWIHLLSYSPCYIFFVLFIPTELHLHHYSPSIYTLLRCVSTSFPICT